MDDLAQYLREHYGACAMNTAGEACLCLQGKRWEKQIQCPDWQPTTATTWEQLHDTAKNNSEAVRANFQP